MGSAERRFRGVYGVSPSYENKRFVDLSRAEWVELLFGREVRPRRERWRVVVRWLRYEAWRLTRLPGDVVQPPDRDVVYLVHSGRPGHLLGWCISGQVLALHGVSRSDPWPLIAHNPAETWLEHLEDVRF